MKEKYDETLSAGADKLETLLSQEQASNSSKVSLEVLQEKLQTAVKHLEHTKGFLQKRLAALKTFISRIDGNDMSTDTKKAAASLLQISSMQDDGPEKSVQLLDPSRPSVVHTLSSQIRELE